MMKNVNESGRSMVEMLGVLAIIGVLSVGGIVGYSRAMETWRANEIIDAANKVIVVAETASDLTADYSDVGTVANVAGGALKGVDVDASAASPSVTINLKGSTTAYKALATTIREKTNGVLGGGYYTITMKCNDGSCD